MWKLIMKSFRFSKKTAASEINIWEHQIPNWSSFSEDTSITPCAKPIAKTTNLSANMLGIGFQTQTRSQDPSCTNILEGHIEPKDQNSLCDVSGYVAQLLHCTFEEVNSKIPECKNLTKPIMHGKIDLLLGKGVSHQDILKYLPHICNMDVGLFMNTLDELNLSVAEIPQLLAVFDLEPSLMFASENISKNPYHFMSKHRPSSKETTNELHSPILMPKSGIVTIEAIKDHVAASLRGRKDISKELHDAILIKLSEKLDFCVKEKLTTSDVVKILPYIRCRSLPWLKCIAEEAKAVHLDITRLGELFTFYNTRGTHQKRKLQIYFRPEKKISDRDYLSTCLNIKLEDIHFSNNKTINQKNVRIIREKVEVLVKLGMNNSNIIKVLRYVSSRNIAWYNFVIKKCMTHQIDVSRNPSVFYGSVNVFEKFLQNREQQRHAKDYLSGHLNIKIEDAHFVSKNIHRKNFVILKEKVEFLLKEGISNTDIVQLLPQIDKQSLIRLRNTVAKAKALHIDIRTNFPLILAKHRHYEIFVESLRDQKSMKDYSISQLNGRFKDSSYHNSEQVMEIVEFLTNKSEHHSCLLQSLKFFIVMATKYEQFVQKSKTILQDITKRF